MTVIVAKGKSYKKAVKDSLCSYLKADFPYQQDWIHPVTGVVWSASKVEAALIKLKAFYPRLYAAIFTLWVDRFSSVQQFKDYLKKYSSYTHTLLKSNQLDVLLFLLYYPHLTVTDLELFFNKDGSNNSTSSTK